MLVCKVLLPFWDRLPKTPCVVRRVLMRTGSEKPPFLFVGIALVLVPAGSLLEAGETRGFSSVLTRSEPLVIEAAQVPRLVGCAKDRVVVFRSVGQAWEQVPFQIDERRCVADRDGDRCEYAMCSPDGTGCSENPPVLLPHDEIVFMSSEAGQCAADPEQYMRGERWGRPSVVEEVRIVDPASSTEACLYIACLSEHPHRPVLAEGAPEVAYRPEQDSIESERYRLRFDKERPFLVAELAVRTGGDWQKLVKGQRVSTEVSHLDGTVVYTIGAEDLRGNVIGFKSGPVRVLRKVEVRVSYGPFLWAHTEQVGIYYRDRFQTSFEVRSLLRESFLAQKRLTLAWVLDPCAIGMEVHTARNREAPVADGVLSPLEKALDYEDPGPILVSGVSGSLLFTVCPVFEEGPKEGRAVPSPGGHKLRKELYYMEGGSEIAVLGYSVPHLESAPGRRQRFLSICRVLSPGPEKDSLLSAEGVSLSVEDPLLVSVGPSAEYRDLKPPCEPRPEPEREGGHAYPSYVLADPALRPGRKWGLVPIVTTGPDKGPGMGLKFRHPALFGRLDSLETRLVYTLYKYQIAELWYRSSRVPFPKTTLEVMCNYYNKPRARFYGMGNRSERAAGRDFTWNDLQIAFTLRRALPFGFGLDASLHARRGGIAHGDIDGWPDLTTLEPQPCGVDGGWSNGVEFSFYRDSRAPAEDPISGGRQSFSWELFSKTVGDYDFERYRLEIVQIVPMPFAGHRLAARAEARVVRGRAPFYELSQVGGGYSARGFYEGRFTDRDRVLLNAEYRFPVYEFFHGVVFLDCGRVYDDLLGSPSLGGLHLAAGIGARFRLYPDLIVRLDAGASQEQLSVYLEFGHTF